MMRSLHVGNINALTPQGLFANRAAAMPAGCLAPARVPRPVRATPEPHTELPQIGG